MRILIVEDDPLLADGLSRSLAASGFAVDHAADGISADHMASSQAYDLIILDLGIPGLDGLSVLKRLRRRASGSSTTPVLILTARAGLEDRVKGLNLGADDYLTKPFDLPELEARVRALVRRGKFGASPQLQHGRLRFDTIGRRALVDDQPLELSARELSMLETLLLHTHGARAGLPAGETGQRILTSRGRMPRAIRFAQPSIGASAREGSVGPSSFSCNRRFDAS
jgi:two-component system OmpR family response regulator